MTWRLTKHRRVKVADAHEWWAMFNRYEDAPTVVAVLKVFLPTPRSHERVERVLIKQFDATDPKPSYSYEAYRDEFDTWERVPKEKAIGMIAVLQQCGLQEVKL